MELEHAPPEHIRAGARGHIDESRRLPAEFSRVHRFLNAELLNRVDRRIDHEIIEELIRDLRAVQKVNVVTRSLPTDVRQRPGLLQRFASRASRRNHHRIAQLGQGKEAPSIQRDLHYFAILDNIAYLGGRRLEQRKRRLNDHLLLEPLNPEHELEVQAATDVDHDALERLRGKSGKCHGEVPLSQAQSRQEESPLCVGRPLHDRPAGAMRRRDQRARQHTTLGVEYDPPDFPGVGLARRPRCTHHDPGRNAEQDP